MGRWKSHVSGVKHFGIESGIKTSMNFDKFNTRNHFNNSMRINDGSGNNTPKRAKESEYGQLIRTKRVTKTMAPSRVSRKRFSDVDQDVLDYYSSIKSKRSNPQARQLQERIDTIKHTAYAKKTFNHFQNKTLGSQISHTTYDNNSTMMGTGHTNSQTKLHKTKNSKNDYHNNSVNNNLTDLQASMLDSVYQDTSQKKIIHGESV